MVDVFYNTWWTDSDATIHVPNTMHRFLNQNKPMESERSFCSGNQMRSYVEAIELVE